jgi:hypothetical protein
VEAFTPAEEPVEEDTGVIEMPEIERALGIVREAPEFEELHEPAPDPGEIRVTAANGTIGAAGESDPAWLDEARRGITMEWPVPGGESRRARDRDLSEPSPVQGGTEFFPRPEGADWTVTELDYSRRRGA